MDLGPARPVAVLLIFEEGCSALNSDSEFSLVLRFAVCGLRFAIYGLRFAHCGSGFRFAIRICGLRFADCGLQIAICDFMILDK